jgi:Icc-related predicted phosphoesterase
MPASKNTIQVLSDLHLEFDDTYEIQETEANIVILAGDTHLNTKGIEWAAKQNKKLNKEIIYLLGNHEYYTRSIEKQANTLKGKAKELDPKIHVLQNEAIIINGQEFFGATLWTDFRLGDNTILSQILANDKQTGMRDFKKIRKEGGTRSFKAEDSIKEHYNSLNKLREFLSIKNESKIVISHHAPSPKSLRTQQNIKDNAYNPAYASDLENLIVEFEPKLWIHGHIHEHKNYFIGNTQILANPRGYQGKHKEDTNHNPSLTLKI